jgi:transposase
VSSPQKIQARHELLRPFLKGRLRRLWAAAEALVIGNGGAKRVAAAVGLSAATVKLGVRELQAAAVAQASATEGDTEPRRGPGRHWAEEKDPDLIPALERLLTDEVAGDPMGEQRWVRSSLRRLSERLKAEGHDISYKTVGRLLKEMGFSLRRNKRKHSTPDCPGRDEQFRYIASQKEKYAVAGLPIISVDTKKKELIGNFRNHGRAWCKEAAEVSEHGFASEAECVATPYGVYDLTKNRGFVVVGLSHNTPEFAATVIARWWEVEGRLTYPRAGEILILADGGGGNENRCRAWKWKLQELVCDQFGLKATVSHYPPGCSKYNPVEHRLFSQISMNWAGKPLRSLGLMLGYIRGTTTSTGLTVQAFLDEGVYKKGLKVSRDEIKLLNVEPHGTCPPWNYTITPRRADPPRIGESRERADGKGVRLDQTGKGSG